MLKPRPLLRSRLAAGAFLLGVVSVSHALGRAPAAVAQPLATNPTSRGGGSLKARFGVDAGRNMLSSRDPGERAAGVERLGTSENPQAVDALIDSLDKLEKAEMLEARLMAVRVLRDHVDRAEVRDFLVKELMTTTQSTRASTFGTILRASAALALARWGDDRCVEALFAAVASRGPAVEAARAALLAYPPRSLEVAFFAPDASIEETEEEEEDDLRDVIDKKPSKGDSKKDKPKAPPKKSEEAKAEADVGFPVPKGMKLRTLAPNVVELLGDLGDLRALPVLRFIARAETASRPMAGLALAKLGDDAALGDARRWAKSDDVRLAETGARILVLLDDWAEEAPAEGKKPAAPKPAAKPKGDKATLIVVKGPPVVKAVARLLSGATTRRAGFQLILDTRSPTSFAPLLEPLATIAREPTGDDRSLAVLAIGRIGGAAKLGPFLDPGPEAAAGLDRVAAFALATMPGAEAGDALTKALGAAKTPAKQRLAVRAGVVRAVAMGAPAAGLEEAITALAKSTDAADVDTVAFARVALGGDLAALVGKAPSAPLIAGAARAATLRGDEALEALVPFLKGADDGQSPSDLHVAAGVALLTPEGRRSTPQQTLLAWAEGGGALAPLAALALPSHDDDAIRPRIKTLLLEGTDPILRAHVAMGLGEDPEPSSVSLLCEAYMSETHPGARRAIVRALAQRTEVQRVRVLTWAAELDPDETNRTVARLALKGVAPKQAASLDLTLSWTLVSSTDAEPHALAARFVRGDDLAVPLLTAPDGDLLVPTQPFGASAVTVYARAAPTSEPERGE